MQKFVLIWINFKINRIRNKAFKKMRSLPSGNQNKTTIKESVDDLNEYYRLLDLRANITTINNPWQGVFAPYWTYSAKNKYIESFTKIDKPIVVPELDEQAEEWSNLSVEEFYEKLDEEDID